MMDFRGNNVRFSPFFVKRSECNFRQFPGSNQSNGKKRGTKKETYKTLHAKCTATSRIILFTVHKIALRRSVFRNSPGDENPGAG